MAVPVGRTYTVVVDSYVDVVLPDKRLGWGVCLSGGGCGGRG